MNIPKTTFIKILFLYLIFIFSVNAQTVVTVPGDYTSIKSVITYLNTSGVPTGGITVNVAAGYAETFTGPTDGLITATGTQTSPILFQKSGTGANPVITAGTGTSITRDAIIMLAGTDYITFDGIDVAENSGNTTTTKQMEFGYALVKSKVGYGGCQYVTIKNCTVTLNKTNTATKGIYVNNHLWDTTSALTISFTSDENSYNKFYNNTITNCYTGIYLGGYSSAPSPYNLFDQGNEVGVSGGNTINNYAGGTTTGYAIYTSYQNNLKISNNRINNGGSTNTGVVDGIYCTFGSNSNIDITYNTVTITGTWTSGSSYMIYNSAGSANAGNTINIKNNTVQNCSLSGSGTQVFYGVYAAGGGQNCYVSDNVVTGNSSAGTGAFYGIYFTSTALNCYGYNNQVYSNSKTGASGFLYGINYGAAGAYYGIHDNTVHDLSFTSGSGASASTIYGINESTNMMLAEAYNNTVYNLSIASNATSTTTGIYGLNNPSSGSVIARNIFGNTVYGLSASGTASVSVYGVSFLGGSTDKVYNNQVYNLASNGASGTVTGINLGYSSGVVNISYIYNNMVSDLRAPNSTSATAISGISVNGGNACYMYYNTVYLNASGLGAAAKTAAFQYANYALPLEASNNIFVNNSTPGTGGFTTAFKCTSATLTNYSSLSNNNCFYAGTPGTNNVIYYDGTNALQTLSAYQAFVGLRDVNSITAAPTSIPFNNISTTPYNLHLTNAFGSPIESGGKRITAPLAITTDIDGNIRQGETGYTGTGTAPDIGADEFEGILADQNPPVINFTALNTAGSTNARTITATITDPSGVPTSGSGLPVLYWKNGVYGVWNSVVSSSVGSNQYSFTFGGGVALTDTVYYYICAQDNASTPNVGSYPIGGAAGFSANPPAAATAPTSPLSYTIATGLSGVVTVGNGGTYPNLTGAGGLFAAINSSPVTGNITANIISDVAETGTVKLSAWTEDPPKSNYTLTIQPADDTVRVISGTYPSVSGKNAMIYLNGASRVTFNGNNKLLLRNTNGNNSANTGPVIRFSEGCTNDVINNCILESNTSGTSGDSTAVVYISQNYAYNNITITGCTFREATGGSTGPYSVGIAANSILGVPANNQVVTVQNSNFANFTSVGLYLYSVADHCIISGNSFYYNYPTSATAGQECIIIGYNSGHVITNNYMGGSAPQCGGTAWVNTGGGFNGLDNSGGGNSNTAWTVQGNVIKNLNIAGTFVGIKSSSLMNVIGNTIGDPTGSTNIINSATTGNNYGIYTAGSGYSVANSDYENNTICNFTFTGLVTSLRFMGINIVDGNIRRNKIYGINFTQAAATPQLTGIQFAPSYGPWEYSNNMVSLDAGSASAPTILRGMGDNSASTSLPVTLCYNTILLGGSGAGTAISACVFRQAAYPMVLKDNILVNNRTESSTGLHYGLVSNSIISALNITADYNDYVTVNANNVTSYDGGTTPRTLAVWKANTGNDTHSLTEAVTTVSTADLHLSGGSLGDFNLRGIPLAGITKDIDGDTRNAYYPYMGADENTDSPLIITLSLKALLGGFTRSVTGHMVTSDTVLVTLQNASLPYNNIDSAKMVLDVTGLGSAVFPNAVRGTAYYIKVSHRNHITTWSADGGQVFTSSLPTYDFTTAQNQAYGSNQTLVGAQWCLYGGDVNKDGIVDLSDMVIVDNDSFNFITGYVKSDTNGDGVVDISDMVIVDNLSFNFVRSIAPGAKKEIGSPVRVRKARSNQ